MDREKSMTKVLRQRTTVQSGGVIALQSNELPAGATVDVIVLVEEAPVKPISLSKLIGTARGCYNNPEEIVEYIRQEREQWG